MSDEPVTLITGASAGIGAELAREAKRRGHRLALTARRADRLEALAAELGGAEIVVADLGRPDGPAALADALAARGLVVGILINNAGFGQRGDVAEVPLASQLGQIDVNIRALTELTVRLLPAMVARGRGGILNVASLAAYQAGPHMAVYYATKAYVLSFTEALHEELRGTGVRVSALCPGPTLSEFAAVADMNQSGLFRRFAAEASAVARTGLDGLEGDLAVNVAGMGNALAAFGTRLMPRSLARKVAGRLQR